MPNPNEIFAMAEEAVRDEWLDWRPEDRDHWRSMQPSQAGMDKGSWLDISERMIRRFNTLSGSDLSNFSISRRDRTSYLGKELGEFVILIADAARQMP